jgi:hypothetical protein
VWRVLDEIGRAMQAFAQADTSTGHGKHCESKRHLGLPRMIDGPRPFDTPPPRDLYCVRGHRHGAPAWYHVTHGKDGLTIRVSAFPSSDTRADDSTSPDTGRRESSALLTDLLGHLKQYIEDRTAGNSRQTKRGRR